MLSTKPHFTGGRLKLPFQFQVLVHHSIQHSSCYSIARPLQSHFIWQESNSQQVFLSYLRLGCLLKISMAVDICKHLLVSISCYSSALSMASIYLHAGRSDLQLTQTSAALSNFYDWLELMYNILGDNVYYNDRGPHESSVFSSTHLRHSSSTHLARQVTQEVHHIHSMHLLYTSDFLPRFTILMPSLAKSHWPSG